MIAIGTMISLAYYLQVIAAIWMRPAPRRMPVMAGAAPEAAADSGLRVEVEPGRALRGGPSGGRCALVLGVVFVTAAATIFFGIYPDPLVEFANNAGEAVTDSVFG